MSYKQKITSVTSSLRFVCFVTSPLITPPVVSFQAERMLAVPELLLVFCYSLSALCIAGGPSTVPGEESGVYYHEFLR